MSEEEGWSGGEEDGFWGTSEDGDVVLGILDGASSGVLGVEEPLAALAEFVGVDAWGQVKCQGFSGCSGPGCEPIAEFAEYFQGGLDVRDVQDEGQSGQVGHGERFGLRGVVGCHTS
ncbi:MAG: hypothetical protein U1E22_09425 [Coriobacteriia bacterium]|nr:hypothetical protein [Coriobacteriia bacterium]